MQKQIKINGINDSHYVGKLGDQQVNGNNFKGKKYAELKTNGMTEYQLFLYNRVLFGLSVYSEQELKVMRWDKRKRIMKVHKRAQSVLNIWKQEITNKWSTAFFVKIFPTQEFTNYFVNTVNDTDPEYVNNLTFKELGIPKKAIIAKLINEGVLPPNFYELKQIA